MFGAFVSERRFYVAVGMVIFKSALLTDTFRLDISVVISTPYSVES